MSDMMSDVNYSGLRHLQNGIQVAGQGGGLAGHRSLRAV